MRRDQQKKAEAKAEKPGWAALAGALQISRETLYNWRKFPTAPKTADPVAWQEWREEHKPEGGDANLADVKRLVELEKLRKLKRENEIGEAKTVPVDEVVSSLREATAKWDSVLTSKLQQEAPARLVGKDIAELRAEMTVINDELREAMARELAYRPERK